MLFHNKKTICIPFSGRPRPTDFRSTGGASNEPLSRKKRQDSYLKAVGGLSPDEPDTSENNSGRDYVLNLGHLNYYFNAHVCLSFCVCIHYLLYH